MEKYLRSDRRYSFEDSDFLSLEPKDLIKFCSTKDENKVLAVRKEVLLEKVAPNKFYNEELMFAVDWLDHPNFDFRIYAEKTTGELFELPYSYLSPELYQPGGLIIFKQKPEYIIHSVSFVKWVGNTIGDGAIKSDGSVRMDSDYSPDAPQSVATKGYVDDLLSLGAKARYLIDTAIPTLTQNGVEVKTIKLGTLEEHENTIFLNKGPCEAKVSFVANEDKLENLKLGIYVDDYLVLISDTLDKPSNTFVIIESVDPYAGAPFGEGTYVKNTYTVSIKPETLNHVELVGAKRNLKFGLLQGKGKNFSPVKYSQPIEFTICSKYFALGEVDRRAISLKGVRANEKRLSGQKVISFKEAVIPVEIDFSGYKDSLVPYFSFITFSMNGQKAQKFSAADVIDGKTLKIQYNMNFEELKASNHDAAKIALKGKVEFFNYHKAATNSISFEFENVIIDFESDESNRVTTPNADVLFPFEKYGEPFEVMEPESMILYNNTYKHYGNNGTLCVVANTELESFSHVFISYDYLLGDGRIQVKPEGNCGWLDATKEFSGFGSPVSDGEAALVTKNSNSNMRFVTMGKKCYNKRVFVRFVGFSEIKNLKVTVD